MNPPFGLKSSLCPQKAEIKKNKKVRSSNMKKQHWFKGLTIMLVFALSLIAIIPTTTVSAASPTITLSSDSGDAGTTVTVSGSHFSDDYYYYVFFDKTYKAKGTVNSSGKFTKEITIPSSKDAGEYKIVVKASEDSNSSPEYTDSYDESAYAYFEVTDDSDAAIDLSTDRGAAGTLVTINGTDFTAGDYYYVFFDETYQFKGVINSNGKFSKDLTIPTESDGTYEITVMTKSYSDSSPAYSDTNYVELAAADFEVTTPAPAPTPAPLINNNPAPAQTTQTPAINNNQGLSQTVFQGWPGYQWFMQTSFPFWNNTPISPSR